VEFEPSAVVNPIIRPLIMKPERLKEPVRVLRYENFSVSAVTEPNAPAKDLASPFV